MNEVKVIKNSDENIEVVSARVNSENNEYWLVGEVKNVSAVKLDYVGVVLAIKNKEGEMVDSVLIYVLGSSNLKIGETGYFKHSISIALQKWAEGTMIITPFYQESV